MRNELKAMRVRKGLTQSELGALIGVGYGTISKWETGESNPQLARIGKLANALGVTTEDIFFALDNHKTTSNK